MNRDNLNKYKEAWAKRKELKGKLKEVEDALSTLAETILEEFEEEGISQIRVDGKLFYTRKDVYFSLNEQEEASFDVLREHGLGHLIETRVSSQSLRSALLEQERGEDGVPQDITDIVKRSEVFRLQVK